MFWQDTLKELPFFPSASDLPGDSLYDKFVGGFQKKKYAADGFIGFHALKICSSNARQTSKLLQLTFGFEEIAYRGLESKSVYTASHVVKNGEVVIEIVNTLQSVDTQNSRPASSTEGCTTEDYIEHQKRAFLSKFDKEINNLVDKAFPGSMLQAIDFESKLKTDQQYEEMYSTISKSFDKVSTRMVSMVDEFVESNVVASFLKDHGEGILDVSFQVEDIDKIVATAMNAGALLMRPPRILTDKDGSVRLATLVIPDTDICHTLVQNIDYVGVYLPDYIAPEPRTIMQPINLPVAFSVIDHCVQNYSWNQMMVQARLYAKMFGFSKFWSVDDKDVHTGNTALKSIVMTSDNGKIKIPINEPAQGRFKSQIEEFYEYYHGPGFQHIALRTNDIISTVKNLKLRGVSFNETSRKYYAELLDRMKRDDVKIVEDIEELKNLNILIDYDPSARNKSSKVCNYILQIFTQPFHDRPTFFFEIIQRHHHNGFGKGTFKGLFETIEGQQRKRGTLVPSKYLS